MGYNFGRVEAYIITFSWPEIYYVSELASVAKPDPGWHSWG